MGGLSLLYENMGNVSGLLEDEVFIVTDRQHYVFDVFALVL